MTAASPHISGEPEWSVFDRSKPPGIAVSLRVLAITMLSLLVYLLARDVTFPGPLGALQSATGSLLFARSLAGVALGGMLSLSALHVGRTRRRFGRCELSPYRARFVLFQKPLAVIEIDQENVRGWTPTPFGVLVEVEGRSLLQRKLQPLLVPTASDEEVALVESLLRGDAGGSDRRPNRESFRD